MADEAFNLYEEAPTDMLGSVSEADPFSTGESRDSHTVDDEPPAERRESERAPSNTSSSAAGAVNTDCTAVSLSNLTWWTTDRDIEQLCSELGKGKVRRMTFNEDKVNGKSKGYVVVEFATAQEAQSVRDGVSGKEVHEKAIQADFVSPAALRAMHQQALKNAGVKPKAGGGGGGGGGGMMPMVGVPPMMGGVPGGVPMGGGPRGGMGGRGGRGGRGGNMNGMGGMGRGQPVMAMPMYGGFPAPMMMAPPGFAPPGFAFAPPPFMPPPPMQAAGGSSASSSTPEGGGSSVSGSSSRSSPPRKRDDRDSRDSRDRDRDRDSRHSTSDRHRRSPSPRRRTPSPRRDRDRDRRRDDDRRRH